MDVGPARVALQAVRSEEAGKAEIEGRGESIRDMSSCWSLH